MYSLLSQLGFKNKPSNPQKPQFISLHKFAENYWDIKAAMVYSHVRREDLADAVKMLEGQ